jgi:hypothetical protein
MSDWLAVVARRSEERLKASNPKAVGPAARRLLNIEPKEVTEGWQSGNAADC